MCIGVCYCPFYEKAIIWKISITIDMLLTKLDFLLHVHTLASCLPYRGFKVQISARRQAIVNKVFVILCSFFRNTPCPVPIIRQLWLPSRNCSILYSPHILSFFANSLLVTGLFKNHK